MTMYLMLFRQGQSAVGSSLSAIGGMVEDNLYLSNLYEYLEHGVPERAPPESTERTGPQPGDGIRFEHVWFRYPGAENDALRDVSFHLPPGQALALVGENGSGKTTIIKLLTRLYRPARGRILLDGRDLERWDQSALRQRIGVIFQDFVRYQLEVGENIGAGDVQAFSDEARWQVAAEQGMAEPFIREMEERYHTQLGKWFKGGRELSGGQWQKIALARAFMRRDADVLVLDEPTAAMDAGAEADVFAHFRALSAGKMTVLVSHRFSTVRMADRILVLDRGEVVEQGSHEELLAADGRYARLFTLQAAGYR
jgi:ABC-type multidrug transport system fused ATPase/permease subunit